MEPIIPIDNRTYLLGEVMKTLIQTYSNKPTFSGVKTTIRTRKELNEEIATDAKQIVDELLKN